MFKIAVVGTGIISCEHLDAIAKSKEFTLCGLCDINEQVVKTLAQKYKVPYFTDYHQMPKNLEMDAVILNLPHFLHRESAVFFLNSGVNVLVEKPMANSVRECDEMLLAAEKNRKKLAVGHIQRFFRVNMELKKLAKEQRFGKFCMFSEIRSINYFDASRPQWFLEKDKSGGGIVMNYGAHALDKLSYLLEEFPEKVLSSFANFKNARNIEGHAQFFLKYSDGRSGAVTFDGYEKTEYQSVYYFTDGVVKANGTDSLFYCKDNQWIDLKVSSDGGHMERQLKAFADYLSGKPSDIADGLYGKNIISVIENIYQN